MSLIKDIAIGIGLGLLFAVGYQLGGDDRVASYGEVWARCLDQAERQLVTGDR